MGEFLPGVPNNQLVATGISSEEFRDGAFDLESFMVNELSDYHVEPEVEHFFADGMYGRKMVIAKDTAIVGKIHKHSHINVISKGVIDVFTEYGVARYEAPITFVSNPLTKRIVKAVEDTVWTTVHVTDSTDLDEIEKEVIADNYDDIERGLL